MLQDMPLDELKTYSGTNPKPDDFDGYWTAALAELESTAPRPEFTPAEFTSPQALCFDLTFTGVGGARVHAKLLKPKGVTSGAPAIVAFHGYSASAYDWYTYLGWAGAGFVVAALDCRGQGGKE